MLRDVPTASQTQRTHSRSCPVTVCQRGDPYASAGAQSVNNFLHSKQSTNKKFCRNFVGTLWGDGGWVGAAGRVAGDQGRLGALKAGMA